MTLPIGLVSRSEMKERSMYKFTFNLFMIAFFIGCTAENIVIDPVKTEKSKAVILTTTNKRVFLVNNQTNLTTSEITNSEELKISISPSTLPPGLSFSEITGVMSGVSTGTYPETTYTITGINESRKVENKITLSSHEGFHVNTNRNANDANLGDGKCETATPGECTITAAIMESAVQNTTKFILLEEETYVLTMPFTLTYSSANITLQGRGMGKTIITSNQSPTSKFVLTAGAVTVNDVTFNEFGRASASIDNFFRLQNSASLSINDSVIQNSITTNGAIIKASNNSTLDLDNVFLYNNRSENSGIIFIEGDAVVNIDGVVWYKNDGHQGGCAEIQIHSNTTINNSICFDNHTRHLDKSALNVGTCGCPTDLDIKNTVISNNTHAVSGSIAGFLIGRITSSTAARVVMSNLIISDNTDSALADKNCFIRPSGGTVTDHGHNLLSGSDCSGGRFTGANNLFSTDPLFSSTVFTIDPYKIPSLDISTSSPIIDAGNTSFCSTKDQLGNSRPVDFNGTGLLCDIGPIEAQI